MYFNCTISQKVSDSNPVQKFGKYGRFKFFKFFYFDKHIQKNFWDHKNFRWLQNGY